MIVRDVGEIERIFLIKEFYDIAQAMFPKQRAALLQRERRMQQRIGAEPLSYYVWALVEVTMSCRQTLPVTKSPPISPASSAVTGSPERRAAMVYHNLKGTLSYYIKKKTITLPHSSHQGNPIVQGLVLRLGCEMLGSYFNRP